MYLLGQHERRRKKLSGEPQSSSLERTQRSCLDHFCLDFFQSETPGYVAPDNVHPLIPIIVADILSTYKSCYFLVVECSERHSTAMSVVRLSFAHNKCRRSVWLPSNTYINNPNTTSFHYRWRGTTTMNLKCRMKKLFMFISDWLQTVLNGTQLCPYYS